MASFAQFFGWLGIVATALALFAMLAVGLHYNPGSSGAEYIVAFGAVVVLPALFLILRLRRGQLSFIAGLCSAAIGLLLVFGGALITLQDPGDALLYAGPMVLGLGLIGLAIEPRG